MTDVGTGRRRCQVHWVSRHDGCCLATMYFTTVKSAWFVVCQQMANIASEKEKLESVEQQHRMTVEELEGCTDPVEVELLRQRGSDEQDAVDNQRFLVDNLEFQQLEVCVTVVYVYFLSTTSSSSS